MSKKIILILASAIIVFTSSASLFSGDKNSPARSESDTLSRKKIYKKFDLEKAPDIKYPNFEIDCGSYKYGNLTLLFGRYIIEPYLKTSEYNYGYRLLALNQKNELVFESDGSGDGRTFYPDFYKLDNNSPILILVEISDEGGSGGNLIFSIKNDTIKIIGFINLAVFHSNGFETSMADISEVMTIEQIGDSLRFEFNADTLAHDPLGINEIHIKAKDWYYLYDNKTLKLIKK